MEAEEPAGTGAIAVEPGIYQNVSFETYSRWNAVNHSILRHFRKTPAHAYWEATHQDESTTYQELGHKLHMAVLEPERFKTEGAVVSPKVDRRTTIGKKAWAAFVKKNAGRPFVKQEEMDAILGIQASLARHATAREMLYGSRGVNELSIVWEDPGTTVLCKARLDGLREFRGELFIFDLKTASAPASTHAWQMAVEKYQLHEQAAHYRNGAAIAAPTEHPRKFAWIVCETVAPWAVRVFQAEDAALEIGADLVAQHLRSYAECASKGVWPAWPEGMDLAGLPAWVYKRFDLE